MTSLTKLRRLNAEHIVRAATMLAEQILDDETVSPELQQNAVDLLGMVRTHEVLYDFEAKS